LDQYITLGGIALVIDMQGATAAFERTVIHNGDARGGYPLPDTAREYARALAIEVALEAVTDRLVQQDAGPAGTQHDRHFAGRRRACAQIREGFVGRPLGVPAQNVVGEI